MLNEWISHLTWLIREQTIWAPLLALLAGLLSSLAPCSLASIPLVMGYVKGSGEDKPSRSFLLSVVFAFGMSATFISLGLATGILGRLVGGFNKYWYIVFGVFLVLMAIQTWGIYYFIKPTNLINKSRSRNYIGAFISGILGGFFSSPCSTPVMIALVSIVLASGANIAWSILLFAAYALGHSMVTIFAGTFTGTMLGVKNKPHFTKIGNIVDKVLGLGIFIMGIFYISMGL